VLPAMTPARGGSRTDDKRREGDEISLLPFLGLVDIVLIVHVYSAAPLKFFELN
jgi:hypothetical protein